MTLEEETPPATPPAAPLAELGRTVGRTLARIGPDGALGVALVLVALSARRRSMR